MSIQALNRSENVILLEVFGLIAVNPYRIQIPTVTDR
jgi:hypothetical protein